MRSSVLLGLAAVIVFGARALAQEKGGAALSARARLIRIEDTRRVEPAVLDSALRSSAASLRRAAALAAGRVGARTHAGVLRELTNDRDSSVASAAFYALGLMKDTGAVAVAEASLRASRAASAAAAWLLGEIGEAGRTALIAVAIDSTAESLRRGGALLALARLRPPPVTPLIPLLREADTVIAWRAAYVLARARSAGAVRALIGASTSPSASVRDYAARGLAKSLAGDSLGGPALDALRRLIVDSTARVRVSAARALGPYGAPAATAIAAALNDADAGVRLTAAAFAHVALDSSVGAWEAAWRADTSFAIRRALAESGARRGMLRSAWQAWRMDRRWQYRAAVATLDGLGPAGAALETLEASLRDSDGRVRATATDALAALADSMSVKGAVRRRLRSLLGDPDFVVRASALGALANGATSDDLLAALRTYAVARRDADLDARLAFWTLVDSALRHQETELPDSVARPLTALPRPAEPLERTRAASIPRFAAWRDSTGVARPDAWYRARARETLSPAPIARIETERGTIELDLFSSDAPMTVHNFVTLARRHYFDGQRFHRVVPNFVVQAGDPRGDGNGGPGYAIRDELNPHRYVRGTLGMALSGPNTGGSQFFVTHSAQPHLDGGYTVFGQLRVGGDVLDRIVQGDRIVRITIH